MGELKEGQVDARTIASLDWIAAKARLRHDPPPEGGRHFWAERMRNAWVAYHAGAHWMRGDFELFQELTIAELRGVRAGEENARLTAEVERLRSGIRDLRQGLLRGLRPGDGAEPEPMTEVSGVVACLDALAREDGAP